MEPFRNWKHNEELAIYCGTSKVTQHNDPSITCKTISQFMTILELRNLNSSHFFVLIILCFNFYGFFVFFFFSIHYSCFMWLYVRWWVKINWHGIVCIWVVIKKNEKKGSETLKYSTFMLLCWHYDSCFVTHPFWPSSRSAFPSYLSQSSSCTIYMDLCTYSTVKTILSDGSSNPSSVLPLKLNMISLYCKNYYFVII